MTPDPPPTARRPAADRWADLAPALAVLALHLAFARGYGVFRDEMYYLACGRHLAWGYVDHPPLVALVARLAGALFGTWLPGLRLFPALAHAAATWQTARLAGDLGGGRFARRLAGIGMALAPVALSIASILSMNAFDLLFWVLLFRLATRLLAGGDPRWALAFGAVAGVGLLDKISVLFVGFGIVVGLVAAGRWDVLRSKWFWTGGALAALLFAPHLVWQQAHGWPTLEFMDRARRLKMLEFSAPGFLGESAIQSGASVLVWLPGLLWMLVSRPARTFRPLAIAFLAVLALLVATHGKPYYLAPAFAAPLAAGGVAWERWTAARPRRGRGLVLAAVVLGNAVFAPLAMPILGEDQLVAYAAALGRAPGSDERHELGRLPQFFADMHGWRDLARDVSKVYQALPESERALACVFGQNYGEAGAIDFFRGEFPLPPAISAHNSYWIWGPGDCSGEVLLVLADRRERLEELFEEVELGGVHECVDCMPYENHLPIWVVRRARQPVERIWPAIKSFI
jgi:hypothetical protein